AKPLQAIPFARVATRLGLGSAEVALACASHAGEADHVGAAERILAAAGLGEDALLCGTHAPWGRNSVFTAASARALHSNCSGCHAGLLAACAVEGLDTATYARPDHPLQRRLLGLARTASGCDVQVGVDGCGLPTYHTPLAGLARAFQWLHRHEPGVLEAMAAHPFLVCGTGEFDTDLLLATRGRVVGKFGALGVYAAVERGSGAALAVRVTTANEVACQAVAGRIMAASGWLEPAAEAALEPHLHLPVLNSLRVKVGDTEFRVP
ncbi:MAG TPA: asparaginase, partial [Candidatus Thermoplasmatota archaeon]|nr:asparaginase [Candidatus Thermoplasmatota archaeon]